MAASHCPRLAAAAGQLPPHGGAAFLPTPVQAPPARPFQPLQCNQRDSEHLIITPEEENGRVSVALRSRHHHRPSKSSSF
jgi:hypothetical protein